MSITPLVLSLIRGLGVGMGVGLTILNKPNNFKGLWAYRGMGYWGY